MIFTFKIFIIWFTICTFGLTNEIKVFEFTEIELSELEVRKVRGADNKTIYTVGMNENGSFYKAVADNAASGLGKKVKIDIVFISMLQRQKLIFGCLNLVKIMY